MIMNNYIILMALLSFKLKDHRFALSTIVTN